LKRIGDALYKPLAEAKSLAGDYSLAGVTS